MNIHKNVNKSECHRFLSFFLNLVCEKIGSNAMAIIITKKFGIHHVITPEKSEKFPQPEKNLAACTIPSCVSSTSISLTSTITVHSIYFVSGVDPRLC
jgi:hypothetical protein